MKNQLATLTDLHRFDCVIDVRTPLEFAEDHLPGAINAPVLSNEERVQVGTMYKQVSAFEATKFGAALVARNIAMLLETQFAHQPSNWKPLIYCWRGGKRSGAMTSWFNLIGWRACQLQGGYKGYRHQVLAQLGQMPNRFRYRVLAGLTGCGKTRLLQALAHDGAQVLDLEGLANHRGSLLGAIPGDQQPSQKRFDSLLIEAMAKLDPARPVFIEAESKKIGQIQLPDSLMQAMLAADRIQIDAALDDRVVFLCDEYAALFDHPDYFKAQLARLTELHSKKRVAHWHALIDANQRSALIDELLVMHYDPAYRRSSQVASPLVASFGLQPSRPDDLATLAAQLTQRFGA